MTSKLLSIVLVCLISILLIIPVLAFEDDAQHHPADDPVQGDDDIRYVTTGSAGDFNVSIRTYGATYNKALYVAMESDAGAARAKIAAPTLDTDYYSFITRNHDGSLVSDVAVILYDSDNVQIGYYSIAAFMGGTYPDNNIYELVRSANNLYLYINGVQMGGSLGACPDSIAYFEFYTNTAGPFGANSKWHIDCISTSGYTIGVGTSESPNYWINTGSNDVIDVEWCVKTIDPFGDWNDTEVYQIKTTWLDTGSVVDTQTLSTGVGDKPHGFKTYSRSSLLPVPNYGTYQFDLLKDAAVMDSSFLVFLPIGESGTLSWNRTYYVPYSDAAVTYTYGTFDLINYNYYVKTYDVDYGLVDSKTLSVISDTVTISLDGWATGDYYSLLVRETKSDGTEMSFAYDLFSVYEEVWFDGITYDAELGTALVSTDVNFTQATTWFNTTSNGTTGAYGLTSMTDGFLITLNASKTNYHHETFDYTPLVSGMNVVDLYLFPTDRSLAGTSIVEGMVVDYPLHQGVGVATVNVYNSTWSSSTSSNAFGYYQFNLSAFTSGTYYVNATLSGYDDSVEYTITVAVNESTVQNILLNQKIALIIKAIDSTSSGYIQDFSATIEDESISTSNGSATFYLDWGIHTVTVSSENYYSSSDNVLLIEDTTNTLTLSRLPSSEYYEPHYVQFTVLSTNGTLYPNTEISIYNGTDEDIYAEGVTGIDGTAGFQLSENVRYRITFNHTSFDKEIYLYPVDSHYEVIVLQPSQYVYNNFTYDLDMGNETLVFTWLDPDSEANWINMTVSNSSGNIQSNNSSGAAGTFIFYILNQSDIYCVNITVDTDDYGMLYLTLCTDPDKHPIAMGDLSEWFLNVLSIFVVIIVLLLFGRSTIGLGCIAATTTYTFLWYIDWLSVPTVSIPVAWIFAIMIHLSTD